MQFIAGTPVGIISDAQEIIEVKLWEVYLLNNRRNLHLALNQFSLDHGPVENGQHEPGRVTYRFRAEDWEYDIRYLLYENRIPVIVRPAIQSSSLIGGKQIFRSEPELV